MQGAEFEQVYDFGNLYAGFLKARRGKRHKPSVAKFEANLLEALCLLSEMLKTKTYRPSDYFVFKVYEPKERIVMTNAFKDKVVQHSLCDNILEPAFSKAFIRDNYASQSGRGTHDGLYRLEEFMRSYYFTRKANAERERILKAAHQRALQQQETMLREAQEQAARTLKRADEQIELEKKQARNELKNEVSDMAVQIAGAVLARDVKPAEHEALIDSFIDGLGDSHD